MFSHSDIWRAIDELAARNGLSTSGLAKRAGLDPTSFNRSKRVGPEGRRRWPSTESLARALACTGVGLDEFTALVTGSGAGQHRVPLIGMAKAGGGGYFDDSGFPTGGGWEEIVYPGVGDDNAYALEVSGDSMEPVYREGDIIVVSPNAPVRRGDRVVVKTRDGEILAKVLQRRNASVIELASFNADHEVRSFKPQDIEWMARILWASQ